VEINHFKTLQLVYSLQLQQNLQMSHKLSSL